MALRLGRRNFTLHDFFQQIEQLVEFGQEIIVAGEELDAERIGPGVGDFELAFELLAQLRKADVVFDRNRHGFRVSLPQAAPA